MSVKLEKQDLELLREQYRQVFGCEPADADGDMYLSGEAEEEDE